MNIQYTEEENSTWERVKAAMKNDWEQTKNDFGSNEARNLNQDVDDTMKQMFNADDKFENRKQALRFGLAAQQKYRSKFPKWTTELDSQLSNDYQGNYADERAHVRYGYEYKI